MNILIRAYSSISRSAMYVSKVTQLLTILGWSYVTDNIVPFCQCREETHNKSKTQGARRETRVRGCRMGMGGLV